MATSRSYGDACGVAHGLDLVGERWALLIVRELLLGPRRFTDLRAGLPGASPNVLSQRVRELEHHGVLHRRRLAPPAGTWVYELTGWGRELEPVVLGLGSWALRSPSKDRDGTLSSVSAVLTLRTYFAPGKAVDGEHELRIGADRYAVLVHDGHLDMTSGQAHTPAAILETDPGTFVSLLGARGQFVEAVRAGSATVTGNRRAMERLLMAVSIPSPAH